MSPPRAALMLLALALAACEHEPRVLELTLELPPALGCRPSVVDEVEVRALGDFSTRDRDVLVLRPGDGPVGIDRFPSGTRVLTVEARGTIGPEPWIGGGVAFVGDRSEAVAVPLLRYLRACPLPDPGARVAEGAAVAALSDGRLMLAGGHEGSRLRDGVVLVHPADPLTTRSPVRLFLVRTGATLTILDGVFPDGDAAVLAGGSASVGGPGEDTFEVLRVGDGVERRVGDGFLASRRREHAAVRVGPAELLLAGGRPDPSEPPLDTLEVIRVDVRGAGSAAVVARMSGPRAGLSALLLEDGTVALVGGVDEAGEPVGGIERFDPRDGALVLDEASFPLRRDAAYAALPGGRIVQVGGRAGESWTGLVELRLEDGSSPGVVALGPLVPALEAPRAAALLDGRVVIVGQDVVTRRARGVVLDPGSAMVVPIEASRAATVLLALSDGTLVEGDAEGLSTLRVDVRTPFDAPPATLTPALMEDRARLALDAPGRWRAADGTLLADASGARLDLPGLRFAGFALEVEGVGALEVLLVQDGAPPITLRVTEDAVELEGCRVQRVDRAPLRVERTGDTLVIDAGAGAAPCAVRLPPRVGVALRAAQGAGVRRIVVARQ